MERDVDLAQLVEGLPDAVVVVGGGAVRWANGSVLGLVGYRADEVAGMPITLLLPDLTDEQIERSLSRPNRPGARLESTARHRDGTEVPIEVTIVDIGGDGAVALVLRDGAIRRTLVHQLVANTELMATMTRGGPIDETMRVAAHHLRSILRADACWVALTPEGAPRLAVVARDEVPAVGGAHGTLAAVPDVSPDSAHALDAGPLLVVELGHAGVAGLVAVARRPGARDFDDADREVASQFAAVVAVALDVDLARRRAATADASAENARIARELHDTVMQRLFAEGLLLETAAPLAPSPVAERIHSAVCNLDDVIREIRETIFEPAAGARSSS